MKNIHHKALTNIDLMYVGAIVTTFERMLNAMRIFLTDFNWFQTYSQIIKGNLMAAKLADHFFKTIKQQYPNDYVSNKKNIENLRKKIKSAIKFRNHFMHSQTKVCGMDYGVFGLQTITLNSNNQNQKAELNYNFRFEDIEQILNNMEIITTEVFKMINFKNFADGTTIFEKIDFDKINLIDFKINKIDLLFCKQEEIDFNFNSRD